MFDTLSSGRRTTSKYVEKSDFKQRKLRSAMDPMIKAST